MGKDKPTRFDGGRRNIFINSRNFYPEDWIVIKTVWEYDES